jgi:hypothetical protein
MTVNIWIAHSKSWVFQILIYDDDGDNVVFKRNNQIYWSKSAHYIVKDGTKVLNPLVTMLYKCTTKMADKDIGDINLAVQRIGLTNH